jgi:hypothetical protein
MIVETQDTAATAEKISPITNGSSQGKLENTIRHQKSFSCWQPKLNHQGLNSGPLPSRTGHAPPFRSSILCNGTRRNAGGRRDPALPSLATAGEEGIGTLGMHSNGAATPPSTRSSASSELEVPKSLYRQLRSSRELAHVYVLAVHHRQTC